MCAAFPHSEYYQRIRLPLWHLPFSGMIHIVRHTRSALSADQDHSGSPRSLDASLSERAVLTDPAAVSGHLAICGVPTGASQPLRYCRPAVKYLTRLNRFTFVTARASLCLRLVRFVASRTQDSIPGEAAHLLSGREFHPLEAPGLSWRAIVKIDVRQQRTDATALNRSYLTLHSLALFQHARLEPFLNQAHHAPVSYAVLDKLDQPSLIESVIEPHDTLPTTTTFQNMSPSLVRNIRWKVKNWRSSGNGVSKTNYI